MQKILVVDDERTVRTAYQKLFSGEGYEVCVARNGTEAVEKAQAERPDLILLDVDMPGKNGFLTCKTIRETDALTPIVFLTAMETDADQMRGLGLGADDYIYKTASTAVLLARVSSVLARRAALARQGGYTPRFVSLGKISVNLDSFEVLKKGVRIAKLTKAENDVLRVLAAHRGIPVSYDDMIKEIYGEGHALERTSLRTYVLTLRRKLEDASEMIASERDVGYRLRA